MDAGSMDVLEYDVVCVGGGGAGMTAAVTAAEAGRRVLVISKEPVGYGSTRIAMGVVASEGLVPGDGPEALYDDLLAGGEAINNPKLAWAMASEARSAPGIAERLGSLFRRDADGALGSSVATRAGGHRFARSLGIPGRGVAMGQALRGAATRAGVDVREQTAAVRLLRDDRHPASMSQPANIGRPGNGVAGLVAWDLAAGEPVVVRAPAVVLAAGGLGWLYYPHTDCTRSATGDGYALAYEAGAELVDMEQVQFLPFACTRPASMVGLFLGEPSWAGPEGRLLDGQGRLLLTGVDRMTRAQVSRVIGLELLKGNGTPHGGMLLDLQPNLATPAGRAAWQRAKDAGSLDVARRAYGRAAYAWEEPWEVAPTAHFHMGGMRIDERGASGVAGLFAAGETAGGLHGANRLGSVALAELFVLGRRAGSAAADYAAGADGPALPMDEVEAAVAEVVALPGSRGVHRPIDLARRLQRVMWESVGVVRSEEALAGALGALDDLEARARSLRVGGGRRHNPEVLDALELRAMLVTARLVAESALLRRETRGAHVRIDYPDRDDARWLANVVARRGERGPALHSESIRASAG